MTSNCSFIPDTIWIREVENGIRHITLRQNFVESTAINMGVSETQYTFEETNVFIPDRDNIEDFITNNFDDLFNQGITNENAPDPKTDVELNTERIIATESAINMLITMSMQ
jgi:hypothetical protein